MKKFIFLQIAGVLIAAGILAENIRTPDFTLFISDNNLIIQLDLSELLSSESMTQIKQGIGELWGIELKLQTPRRFFGSSLVSTKQAYLKLEYKMLTDAFLLSSSIGKKIDSFIFSDTTSIENYFRDSLSIPIANIDSLKREKQYNLLLKLTSISLTDINLGVSDPSSKGEPSPLEFLFQKFLGLINYGKSEQEFLSEPFTINGIPSKP